jgi:hypothetical protein
MRIGSRNRTVAHGWVAPLQLGQPAMIQIQMPNVKLR